MFFLGLGKKLKGKGNKGKRIVIINDDGLDSLRGNTAFINEAFLISFDNTLAFQILPQKFLKFDQAFDPKGKGIILPFGCRYVYVRTILIYSIMLGLLLFEPKRSSYQQIEIFPNLNQSQKGVKHKLRDRHQKNYFCQGIFGDFKRSVFPRKLLP